MLLFLCWVVALAIRKTELPYMLVGNMGDFRNIGTHKNEGIGTNTGPDYTGNTSASGVTDKTGQPLQGRRLTDMACQVLAKPLLKSLNPLCIRLCPALPHKAWTHLELVFDDTWSMGLVSIVGILRHKYKYSRLERCQREAWVNRELRLNQA